MQAVRKYKMTVISNLRRNPKLSPKLVLTIAGFDPSSGAGITADLKTIAAHGLYGTACITAVTVQSTRAVGRIHPLPPDLITETLEELFADSPPAAVRIGMLASASIARAVVQFLRTKPPQKIVLDPILQSSSGTPLLDSEGIEVLKTELLSLAEVVTPNLYEASKLTGLEVADLESMRLACQALHEMGARNVVVKGGHLAQPTDLLAESLPGGNLVFREYPGERVDTSNTHGTGCAFATALACNLALRIPLADGVAKAKGYVAGALKNAYSVGKGPGPVNHLHAFRQRS